MKYLPLFHHFKAIYQFRKHIIVFVKVVANASLRKLLLCTIALDDLYEIPDTCTAHPGTFHMFILHLVFGTFQRYTV